jgi:hypothetical protein
MNVVAIPFRTMLSIHLFNAILKTVGSVSLEGFNLFFWYKTRHCAQSPKLRRTFCQACVLAFSQSMHHENVVSDYWQLVLEN